MHEVRIDEEVAEAGITQMLLDADAMRLGRGAVPRIPRTRGTIGALGDPASGGRAPDQPLMLRNSDPQLQLDALIAREQRQESVRRGRRNDLDDAARLEPAQRAEDILFERSKQIVEALQPL